MVVRRRKFLEIKIEKQNILYNVSIEEFEKEMEIKYLEKLVFENEKNLKWALKRCAKSLKRGDIEKEEMWLGYYFDKEINNGFVNSVFLKWIDPVLGYGLFADREFQKGTYICEYVGSVKKFRRSDLKNPYCFEYVAGYGIETPLTIDAREQGNLARFINHSNKPNIIPELAFTGGLIHVILRTSQFVAKGNELTYDYGPKYWSKRESPILL